MKNVITYVLLVFSCALMAQPNGKREEKFERIKALRVQFISNKLDLTVEEAKVFWPLYDEFKEAEDAIQGERMKARLRGKRGQDPFEDMSDAEIEKLMKDEIKKQRALIDLRETYMAKFKAILPIRKVALLFKAEHDFHRKLIEELRSKGKERK